MKKHNPYRDAGILLLRLGFGIMFMMYGFPILLGGADKWASIGGNMSNFGINFGYTSWGFMSGITDFGGGILLTLGLFTRPVVVFMMLNMIVAAGMHISKDHTLMSGSHAIEDGIVFLSLIFIGAGRYSLDRLIGRT